MIRRAVHQGFGRVVSRYLVDGTVRLIDSSVSQSGENAGRVDEVVESVDTRLSAPMTHRVIESGDVDHDESTRYFYMLRRDYQSDIVENGVFPDRGIQLQDELEVSGNEYEVEQVDDETQDVIEIRAVKLDG